MSPLPRTPLHNWIARRISLVTNRELTHAILADYQLARLKETLDYAKAYSPFYHQRLAAYTPVDIHKLSDLSAYPFTTAEDIQNDPLQFLSVSQSAVKRVVTLRTSGTTHHPKRIYFTDNDLERTVDFFHHGMSTLVKPGQRVLILMPGHHPDSIGELLVRGLQRMGTLGIVHGPVVDPDQTMAAIRAHRIDTLVGIPIQVLALARHPSAHQIPSGQIKSILLSTDYIPRAVEAALLDTWQCTLYQHYGMTEMGYGGAVTCSAGEGYHLRETDLYFEIVNPQTGTPLPPGCTGEVVFTTLNHEAMPLIRYRTGDLAAFLTQPCPCGTVLRRMGKVRTRIKGQLHVNRYLTLTMADLDEVILVVPHVMDYHAAMCDKQGKPALHLTLYVTGKSNPSQVAGEVQAALYRTATIGNAILDGWLTIKTTAKRHPDQITASAGKRIIEDRRTGATRTVHSHPMHLQSPSKPLCAIIPAAGLSQRMGDFKPLLPMGTSTVVERVITLYRQAGIKNIHVVIGHQAERVSAQLRDQEVCLVSNPDYHDGMFTSILAGLRHLPPTCHGFFIHPVDIPLVRPATVTALSKAFATSTMAIYYPTYQGTRGHPTLINAGLIPEIASWPGHGGLRACLAHHENKAMELPVADEAITLDLDTPQDYHRLQKRLVHLEIPTPAECQELMAQIQALPPAIIRHGHTVATQAGKLTAALLQVGLELNQDLIQAAALLHDIARTGKAHARVGARLLERHGFPHVAAVVRVHMDLEAAADGPLTEAEVVYLADKLVSGDTPVTLATRFHPKKAKYGKDPQKAALIARREQNAHRIRARIEHLTGRSLEQILDYPASV